MCMYVLYKLVKKNWSLNLGQTRPKFRAQIFFTSLYIKYPCFNEWSRSFHLVIFNQGYHTVEQLADQPKFFPTIHFQLQFTCTWSGPKSVRTIHCMYFYGMEKTCLLVVEWVPKTRVLDARRFYGEMVWRQVERLFFIFSNVLPYLIIYQNLKNHQTWEKFLAKI